MSPNTVLIFLALILSGAGLIALMGEFAPRWLARFFRIHGETILYLCVFLLATAWLGPNLDAYDRAKHEARMAQR